MSEENLNQNNDQRLLSDADVQRRRNVANNAHNVRAAADIASKTNNPYAKAIGTAVKAADKISDGRASQALGKTLNMANKFTPGGRLTQTALNKMSESGTTDRIANAVNKKNSSNLSNNLNSQKNNLNNKNNDVKTTSPADDTQETGEGFANFEMSKKVINAALILSIVGMGAVVFCCLLVAGPQTYLNCITLGNADSASSGEIEDKINRSTDEEKNEQITDESLQEVTNNQTSYNVTIENKTYSSPYMLTIFNWTKKKRKYTESDLTKLEDFYGGSLSYNDETAYDFYYKLYDIYIRYSSVYDVELDLPLLMSTLMLESKDMSVVFESNTSDDNYDYTTITNSSKDHILDYHHDWASEKYIISSESSAHDIEILAQNMVSIDSNGDYVIDEAKYKEFLKEFLEKKYFIKGGGLYEGKADNKVNNETSKDGNYVSGVTYVDSSFGDVVYYNQGDYANYYYSSDPQKAQYYQSGSAATIKSHGCGPTSLAIVLSSILGKQITPIETTSAVCKAGGCTSSGSVYSTLVSVAQSYGVSTKTTSTNQDVIDALSTNNSLVIVLMGPGTFTSGGHFIVLTGVNSSGQVSVADPGSRARTEQKWFSFNTVVEQRKTYATYMIFSR